MLASIKLIGHNEKFNDIKPIDFILAPEKPVKRRRATKPKPKHIKELDDSFEPLGFEDSEFQAN
jgi:hypothetical protein